MLRRLSKRAESSGRIDDNPEAFKKRLNTYKEESIPVLDHLRNRGSVRTVCLHHSVLWTLTKQKLQIDCHGSPDEVYASLKPVVEDLVDLAEANS